MDNDQCLKFANELQIDERYCQEVKIQNSSHVRRQHSGHGFVQKEPAQSPTPLRLSYRSSELFSRKGLGTPRSPETSSSSGLQDQEIRKRGKKSLILVLFKRHDDDDQDENE